MTIHNIGLNTGNRAGSSVVVSTIDGSNVGSVQAGGVSLYMGSTSGTAIQRLLVLVGFGGLSGAGTVTGAALRLNNADAVAGAAYELRALSRVFTQGQATWNSRLTGTSWIAPGVLDAASNADFDSAVIGMGNAPATQPTPYDITGAGLNAWVQGCIDGTITVPALILSKVNDTGSYATKQRVRADGAVDGIRPLLTFDFTPTALPNATISDPVVSRISGTATFTVTLSSIYASDASVNFATADGTATAGVRYTTTTATVTIPAGQTTGTVTVPILP